MTLLEMLKAKRKASRDEREPDGALGSYTRSLRSMRNRARVPRVAFLVVVGVFAFVGVRQTFNPPAPEIRHVAAAVPQQDLAPQAFAEQFARVYLSWDPDTREERQRRVGEFLPDSLDADGGVTAAEGTSQEVLWTTVNGARVDGRRTTVLVTAATDGPTVRLSVPVERDKRGFMYVSGYPAIVGPPLADPEVIVNDPAEVEDEKLVQVVERALTNYLGRAQTNLMADLAPGAVVSLPTEALDVTSVNRVGWRTAGRRVTAEVEAADARGTEWTLRYELDVERRDRWYVRSLQVNPTLEGGK